MSNNSVTAIKMISVIITVFNKSKEHVKQCVNSVLFQSLRPHEYEVILVDDGSTSPETVASINDISLHHNRICVIKHEHNRGPNEARRTGVKAASGDYIVFVDGDDFLTADAIESLRMHAINTKADVVLANFYRYNEQTYSYDKWDVPGKNLSIDYCERLKFLLSGQSSFTMCGRLFRRSLLDDSIFKMPYILHEDIVSFTRILFNSSSVASLNRYIYYYRWTLGSITSKVSIKHIEGLSYAFLDWTEKAGERQILEKLKPSISTGMGKLINTLVSRSLYSSGGFDSTLFSLLAKLLDEVDKSYVCKITKFLPGICLLEKLQKKANNVNPNSFSESDDYKKLLKTPIYYNSQAILKEGIQPSEMASRLKDKIVIICQVDYHFRNAAAYAKKLALRGYPCVVIDNSAFAAGGKRVVTDNDRKLLWRTAYVKIQEKPYGTDWLCTARLVVTFNDFNDDIRESLEYRSLLGQKSVCIVEGINDFLRVDFDQPRFLPYRRCETVFLAGENDKKYFTDRKTYNIGLPLIEDLIQKKPVFPSTPQAVLNVNFSYGALENCRSLFVETAKRVFEKIGWKWVITQHPMDTANLDSYPVSKKSQNELIDESTVFISRFATGILEALASGKPAIYFNPHGEKVSKFKNPLGAFEIANSEEELIHALRNVNVDIKSGVDFRERASLFLRNHAGYKSDRLSASDRFADAVVEIIESDDETNFNVAQKFFERLDQKQNFRIQIPGLVFGDLDRRNYAQLEETDLLARYFTQNTGIMIDVGANVGQSADTFLGKGWEVHAFEPDPSNREHLKELQDNYTLLKINSQAVSDKSAERVKFYSSKESTGISSLSAFSSGHSLLCEVETVTLSDYCRSNRIEKIDFLKIDVEGHDKFVLDGVDWDFQKPEVVLCEYEDSKTLPNGYSAHDLANILEDKGYFVYVSEWLPIERYGLAHDWRRLIRYSSKLDLSSSWGNFIAFRKDPGEALLHRWVVQSIKFAPKPANRVSNASIPTQKPSATSLSGFTVNGPNRWIYRKPSKNIDSKKPNDFLIFPLEPSVPTVGREFLGAIHLVCNVACTVEFTLARKDTNQPFEGRATKAKIAPGTPWIGLVSHRFKENHDHLKLQIALKDMEAESAELEIQARAMVETPRSLAEHLDSDTDLLSQAGALFRQAKYAEAVSLHALLAIRNPGVPYYERMAKLGIASLEGGGEDFKNIIFNKLKALE